jgi:hypothetical protein
VADIEPFIHAAVLCEEIGRAESGLTSLIGLVNGLTIPVGRSLPFAANELLWLGFVHDGRLPRQLSFFVRVIGPDGPLAEGKRLRIDLKANEPGAEFQMRIQIPIEAFGLHVIEVCHAETAVTMARTPLNASLCACEHCHRHHEREEKGEEPQGSRLDWTGQGSHQLRIFGPNDSIARRGLLGHPLDHAMTNGTLLTGSSRFRGTSGGTF